MKCPVCENMDIRNETYRNMRKEKTYIGLYCNNCKRNKVILYAKKAHIELAILFEDLGK